MHYLSEKLVVKIVGGIGRTTNVLRRYLYKEAPSSNSTRKFAVSTNKIQMGLRLKIRGFVWECGGREYSLNIGIKTTRYDISSQNNNKFSYIVQSLKKRLDESVRKLKIMAAE